MDECQTVPFLRRAEGIDLGSEDSWSEDIDNPQDSEEEEYLCYGEAEEDSYVESNDEEQEPFSIQDEESTEIMEDGSDDEMVLGMDEDYSSLSDTDSQDFNENSISTREVKDILKNAMSVLVNHRKGQK